MHRKVKPLIPGRTEKQVTAAVLDAAACLGIKLERRNVGGMTGASGKYVAFGSSGDSDYYAIMPDGSGRMLAVEIKREGFDPRKARGKELARFRNQADKLRAVNAAGGVGLWTRDAGDFLHAMRAVLSGCRIEIDDDGFCWVTDE
jgi:hypothetical protein